MLLSERASQWGGIFSRSAKARTKSRRLLDMREKKKLSKCVGSLWTIIHDSWIKQTAFAKVYEQTSLWSPLQEQMEIIKMLRICFNRYQIPCHRSGCPKTWTIEVYGLIQVLVIRFFVIRFFVISSVVVRLVVISLVIVVPKSLVRTSSRCLCGWSRFRTVVHSLELLNVERCRFRSSQLFRGDSRNLNDQCNVIK